MNREKVGRFLCLVGLPRTSAKLRREHASTRTGRRVAEKRRRERHGKEEHRAGHREQAAGAASGPLAVRPLRGPQPRAALPVLGHGRVRARRPLEPRAAGREPEFSPLAAAARRPHRQSVRVQLHEPPRVRGREREQAAGAGGRPVRLPGEADSSERGGAREPDGHLPGEADLPLGVGPPRDRAGHRAQRAAHVGARVRPEPPLRHADRVHGVSLGTADQAVPRPRRRRVPLGLRGQAVSGREAVRPSRRAAAPRQVRDSRLQSRPELGPHHDAHGRGRSPESRHDRAHQRAGEPRRLGRRELRPGVRDRRQHVPAPLDAPAELDPLRLREGRVQAAALSLRRPRHLARHTHLEVQIAEQRFHVDPRQGLVLLPEGVARPEQREVPARRNDRPLRLQIRHPAARLLSPLLLGRRVPVSGHRGPRAAARPARELHRSSSAARRHGRDQAPAPAERRGEEGARRSLLRQPPGRRDPAADLARLEHRGLAGRDAGRPLPQPLRGERDRGRTPVGQPDRRAPLVHRPARRLQEKPGPRRGRGRGGGGRERGRGRRGPKGRAGIVEDELEVSRTRGPLSQRRLRTTGHRNRLDFQNISLLYFSLLLSPSPPPPPISLGI